MSDKIVIKGIETNNLKCIDVELKKKAINLIIGPSGSGKSSLAYDTIAQIGQHEFFSTFSDNIKEPSYKIQSYHDMIVSIPLKQININNNIRSTVGTYFGFNRKIAFIFAALLGVSENFFVLNKETNVCPDCHGLGVINSLDESKIVNYNTPICKNPFRCWNRYKDFYTQILIEFCLDNNIDYSKKFKELSEKDKQLLLYGKSEKKYSIRYKKNNSYSRRTTKFFGVMTEIPMLINHSISKEFYSEIGCKLCLGEKYSKEYHKYKIFGLSIGELMMMPFKELIHVMERMISDIKDEKLIFTVQSIYNFIKKAVELNLGHIFFHRTIPTLSGGELQRLRMVQVFNTQLSDLLIVLDEPLAGLSSQEKEKVYKNILELSVRHTLLIVDHSEIFIKKAKKIIALGEKGGKEGGYIIDENEYLNFQRKTWKFEVLKTEKEIAIKSKNFIYNYKGVNISILDKSLNLLIGSSGIGKTTLLKEYLPRYFESYIYINQKPLIGNNNSSVATVLNIFGALSNIFAKKYKKDKKFFSNFTGNEGTCPICHGAGYLEYGYENNKIKIECSDCEGTGFNKNLKKYKILDKNIFDIWKMTIDEACAFFKLVDEKIYNFLLEASAIMLGHLKIGQPISTLSGGENVRIKVLKTIKLNAKVLGIDEPFKGLNNFEIYNMVVFLEKLRKMGKTIIVVDHTEGIKRYFAKQIILENREGILTEK